MKTVIQTRQGRRLLFALLHSSSPSSTCLPSRHPQAGADHFHPPPPVSDCGTAAVPREAGEEIKETNDTWRLHLGGQRTVSSYCDYARAIVNMCFCWVYINLHMFPNSPGDGKPLGTMLAFPITKRHVLCCCLVEWKRPCVMCVCVSGRMWVCACVCA